jgi:hypothetical protein
MARISNDQRIANLHDEALAQFDDVQTHCATSACNASKTGASTRWQVLSGKAHSGTSTRTSPSSRSTRSCWP